MVRLARCDNRADSARRDGEDSGERGERESEEAQAECGFVAEGVVGGGHGLCCRKTVNVAQIVGYCAEDFFRDLRDNSR